MPEAELKARLKSIFDKNKVGKPGWISKKHFEKLTSMKQSIVRRWIKGLPPRRKPGWSEAIGARRQAKLARLVLRIESGEITNEVDMKTQKKESKLVFHDKPSMPIRPISRVLIGEEGPKISVGAQRESPKMPSFKGVFAVQRGIQLPKLLKK